MSCRRGLFGAILLALVAFTGCASPPHAQLTQVQKTESQDKRLLALRIERWGETRFSGLLALQFGEATIHYAMLDASGVKLLEAKVDTEGETLVLHAKGTLGEAGLPAFLAEALTRVFLQEPHELPCTGGWWRRLCRENEHRKSVYLGPLPLWRVEFSNHPGESTVYYQPWLGVRLVLRPVTFE